MMSHRTRRSRMGLAFAGITAGFLALFAPTADAGTVRVPQHMRTAVVACQAAPVKVRKACQSLYLRPRLGDVPTGRRAVAECYAMARDEHRPGTRPWGRYLTGCIRGNLRTP